MEYMLNYSFPCSCC